jgi:hypothetical protein
VTASARFVIESLSTAHKRERATFTCGVERIDTYFRKSVSQDVDRRYATCFVACEIETGRLSGFYTLSSNSVLLNEVPPDLAKKLPRYPTVPAAPIGWLARHEDFPDCRLGELLLFDAIKTVAEAPIGTHAIFAHAIDDDAANFYAAYDFVPLTDKPRTLYLPMATALAALR